MSVVLNLETYPSGFRIECKCLASRIRDWKASEVKRRHARGEVNVRIADTDYFDDTYYERHPMEIQP